MGAGEHSGDVDHRYELRRRLLGSRFFKPQVSRWERMMSYTAPLIAGGMMVGVFTLMATHISTEPEVGPQTISSNMEVAQTPTVVREVNPIRTEDFLSDPSSPVVSLAEFGVQEKVEIRFIPVAHQQYVRIQ